MRGTCMEIWPGNLTWCSQRFPMRNMKNREIWEQLPHKPMVLYQICAWKHKIRSTDLMKALHEQIPSEFIGFNSWKRIQMQTYRLCNEEKYKATLNIIKLKARHLAWKKYRSRLGKSQWKENEKRIKQWDAGETREEKQQTKIMQPDLQRGTDSGLNLDTGN